LEYEQRVKNEAALLKENDALNIELSSLRQEVKTLTVQVTEFKKATAPSAAQNSNPGSGLALADVSMFEASLTEKVH